MTTVVFVKATFKPLYEKKKREVPTGETKSSIFGLVKTRETRTEYYEELKGYSDKEIDGVRFSIDLNDKILELERIGFTVQQIIPVISGDYNYKYSDSQIVSKPRIFGDTEKVSGGGSYGFGYGYSYTEGVMIYASK